MRMENDARELPTIIPLGADDSERQLIVEGWQTFDVEECQCHVQEDKVRMMAVIGRHPGGLYHFNTYVRAIAAALLGSARPRPSSTESSTSAQWLCFEEVLIASMALTDWQCQRARSSATSSASTSVVPEPTVIPGSLSLG